MSTKTSAHPSRVDVLHNSHLFNLFNMNNSTDLHSSVLTISKYTVMVYYVDRKKQNEPHRRNRK